MQTTHAIRCLLSALLFVACASAKPAPTPVAPPELAVPQNQALLLCANARGTQDYRCQAKADGSGYEWSFIGPDAELFDLASKPIGTHGAGPSWELNDGSRVTGTVKRKVAVPESIPMLLLEATSTKGKGTLSAARYIQRLDTDGGAPPDSDCDQFRVSAVAHIPYTATYCFYGVAH